MEQEIVRLYTRQNDKTLHQLKRNGRFINHRFFVELHLGDIAPIFLESYDWLTREAAKRVPKPADVTAPIWCSISTENCLRPISGTVVYVLEVPKEHIIYFDHMKWDCVLNRVYLPADAEDKAAYQAHLRDIQVENGLEFIVGKYQGRYPEEEQRIRDSWYRIFEIDHWGLYNVCANLWEIKQEWVKQIVYPGEKIIPEPGVVQEDEVC